MIYSSQNEQSIYQQQLPLADAVSLLSNYTRNSDDYGMHAGDYALSVTVAD